MAKISKTNIYVPDTTLSPNDTWVGSDAQDFFKTKTFTAGALLDYILVNYGGTEQNNIVVEKPLGDIDTTVADALIDTINGIEAYTVAANEIIAFTGSFLEANNAIPKMFVYLLQTGKGYYGVDATQLTEGDLLLINPFQPQIEANTTNINTIINNGAGEEDKIISGGAFVWTEDELIFQWTYYMYYFNGGVFSIGYNNGNPNLITLDAPDVGETNPRIDLISIDGVAGTVVVTKGVPSPTPQEPTLVFGTQLRITSIYVPVAGDPLFGDGVTPISTVKVYDENLGTPTEWDVTELLGVGVVSDDPTAGIPSDLYNIKFPSNLGTNQYEAITLTATTPATYSTDGSLIFQLKQSERWESSTRLVVILEDSTTATVEVQLGYISILPFGFDSANDDTWMTVAIPVTAFDISGGGLADINKVTIQAHNHPVLYIDNIRYQTGIGTPSAIALSGSDYSEWATYTGTRVGNNLLTILGDYDISGDGTRIEINDSTTEINNFGYTTSSQGFGVQSLGHVFIGSILSDNITSFTTVQLPDASGTLPISVNGEVADAAGNITINAVTKVGTPVNNQLAVWTGDGTIEGDSNITWDGNSFLLEGSYVDGVAPMIVIPQATIIDGVHTGMNVKMETGQVAGSLAYHLTGNGTTWSMLLESSVSGSNNNFHITKNYGDSGSYFKINGLTDVITLPKQTIALIDAEATGKSLVTKEWVQAQDPRPYKVYTALISQAGTAAPTAIVLENTLGGVPVWTRSSTGIYLATLAGVFIEDKTFVMMNTGHAVNGFEGASWVDANSIQVVTYLNTPTYADSRLAKNGSSIEIRVYN